MYQFKIVFAILLTTPCIIEAARSQTNYCSADLCKGNKHIACNNEGNYAADCSKNATVIRITPKLRRRIVHKHNALRNRVANGDFKGYKSAVRMATMRWSPELAKLAEYNVKQCKMNHDKCRNTNEFHYSGQNLAKTAWSGQKRGVGNVVLKQMQSWIAENKKCSMNVIRNLKNISNYGHFTTMVQEKNIAVGCAILRQTVNGQIMQLMTCNYAYNNIIDKPVYRDGKTASKCKTGQNPRFKALCSFREKYNLKSVNF